jgi:4-amino-4-deoxy-L-arabinose transferase-like glycosyltransferase
MFYPARADAPDPDDGVVWLSMIGGGSGTDRSWWRWIGLWSAVGLGIRLASLFGPHRSRRAPGGDSYYFHYAANLLAEGKGFINPFVYYSSAHHAEVQTALWPPLFVVVLAIPSLVGLKTFFAHRVWCCVIGAAGIVVCGLAGREIGGRRVGLIAAFLVAVYPNIWMSDELALSEALSPVLAALVLLLAYRFWKDPGIKRAIWLGLSVGLAMLGRDELTVLVVFLVVPLVLTAKALSWRRRFAVLGVALLATAVVLAPWVGYNLARFQRPVLISNGLGVTLDSANCASVYSGPSEGYWSLLCALTAGREAINPHVDESVQESEAQAYAVHYIRTHLDRVFPVEMARIGRAFGFFHPLEQIELDSTVETRPYHWALVGLGMYYVMLVLSVGGVVVLRRRRIPVFPLVAFGLDVLVSVSLTFGNTRYRSTFEIALVLLSAVCIDAIWSRLPTFARASGRPDPCAGSPPPRPAPASDPRGALSPS